MEEKYFALLIDLAKQAYKVNESPISAIIVCKNKIIAMAHNQRNRKGSTISHAEIEAIEIANKELNDWRLNKCTMYVTVKPCEMCEKVIREARIEKVYYLLEREVTKKQYNKTEFIRCDNIYDDLLITEYKNLLAEFWKNKR